MKKAFLIVLIIVAVMMATGVVMIKIDDSDELKRSDFKITSSQYGWEQGDVIKKMKKTGTSTFFFYYDDEMGISKANVIKTWRGIRLGDEQSAVFQAYGRSTRKGEFDITSDIYYQEFLEKVGPYSLYPKQMEAECKHYIQYAFKDKYSITFYTNSDEIVTWIVFSEYVE